MTGVHSGWPFDSRIWLLLAVALAAGPAAAQSPQPKVFELKNGVFRPAAPVTLKSAAPSKPASKPEATLPQTAARSANRRGRTDARELLRTAAEIERLSRQSFQRSLLNLEDHAGQLDVVLQMRLAAADRHSHPEAARRAAYRHRAESLRQAAAQTASVGQIGAAGWASESAYGQLLASSAAADWAKARGDQLAQQTWAEQSKSVAQNLLRNRGWDHRMGLTGDRQLLDAQARAATAGGQGGAGQSQRNAAQVVRLRKMIDSHITRLEQSQQLPAGNTRPDELHAARARLLASTAGMELMAGRKNEAKRALLEADRHAALEFQDLRKFQQTGTAGLPELIRNWRGRKQLQQSLIDAGFEIPNNHWAGRARDLKAMTDIAENTLDRRGRNGADVAVVQGLVLLEQVRPFVKKKPAAGKKPAAEEKTAAPVSMKVFDVREEIAKARARVPLLDGRRPHVSTDKTQSRRPSSSATGSAPRPIIRDIPPRRTQPTPFPTGETSAP